MDDSTPVIPHVVYDHREKESRRAAVAKKQAYTSEEVKNMPVADYIMSYAGFPQYAFEYKTIQDFSGDKGRDLWTKLDAIEPFPFPVLVIEGHMDHNAKAANPQWRYDMKEWLAAKAQTDAAIAAILERRKVAILWVESETDFADWLAVFAKRLTREVKPFERPVETRKPAKRTLREEQEDVLCAISGVGRKASRNLLGNFKSVKALASASPDDIVALDGFGKKTSAHIYEVFNSPYEAKKDD